MPDPREPTPGLAPVAPGGHADRVTGHSLHDAIDDAIEHVVENDRKHPPHDEVPTASRDEPMSGTPAARAPAGSKVARTAGIVALIAIGIVGLVAAVWK
jgi:hypothetical protein